MNRMRFSALVFLVAVTATQAAGRPFPTEHPKNLKAAQAQGLHRLSADELKAFLPGVMVVKHHKGGKPYLRIYKPDGVFRAEAFLDVDGTWRIDDAKNTWCRTVYKKKELGKREDCFAVFRAPDGIHYFDYDTADTFYASTWRPRPSR